MSRLVATAPVRATEPPVVARPLPASTDSPTALDKIGKLIRFEVARKIDIEDYIIRIGESKEYTKCLEEYTKGLERIKLRIANLRGFEAYFKSIGNTEGDTIKAYGWGVYCHQMSPNDSRRPFGQPEKTGISSVDTIDIIKNDGTRYRFKLNSSFKVQKERLSEEEDFFPNGFNSGEDKYDKYYVKDSKLKHENHYDIATTLTDSLLYKDHFDKKIRVNGSEKRLVEAISPLAAEDNVLLPSVPGSVTRSDTTPPPPVQPPAAPDGSAFKSVIRSFSDSDFESSGAPVLDEPPAAVVEATATLDEAAARAAKALAAVDEPPPPPVQPVLPPAAASRDVSEFAPDESRRSPESTEPFTPVEKNHINDLMHLSGDDSFSFWSSLKDPMKINIKKKIFDPAIPDTYVITNNTIEDIRTKIAGFYNRLCDFCSDLNSCADDFIDRYEEEDTIETWIGADYDNFLWVYQLYCVTQKFPDYFLMFCYQTSGIIPGLFSKITDRGRFFEKLKGYFEGNTISSEEGYEEPVKTFNEEAVKTFMEQAGSTPASALSAAAENIVNIINRYKGNPINKFFLEKYFYDNCGINEKMGFRTLVNQLDIIEEDKKLLRRIFNDHKNIKDMSGGDLIKFEIRTDE